MKRFAIGILLAATATFAVAGDESLVKSVSIDKPVLKVGEPFKLTVQGTQPAGKPCDMMVSTNGGGIWSELGLANTFPYTGAPSGKYATFAAPGTYEIKVEGTTSPGKECMGMASVTVKVEPQVTISSNTALSVTQSPCPAGWHGAAQPSGALTCHPNKPAQKVQCPPKTQYFENECEFGCQQVIY